MARTLARQVGHDRNNFNLLRTICAIAVIVSHAFPLAGSPEPFLRTGLTPGTCAVVIFFAVSGFLVAGSFDRRSDLVPFFIARIRRICPALLVVLILSALVLGPLVTNLNTREYYRHPQTFLYIIANGSFNTSFKALPGVFIDAPHRYPVNGSLWSLPLEVLCYITLYVAGRAGFLHPGRCGFFLLVCLIFSFLCRLGEPEATLPHVLPSFVAGIALHAYRHHIPSSILVFAALAIVTYAARSMPFHYELVRMTIAYGALCFATGSSSIGRYVAGRGDYSYGLYLYGWPVTQWVVYAAPGINVLALIAVVLPITTILAIGSWHLVEKRVLDKKLPFEQRPFSARTGSTALFSADVGATRALIRTDPDNLASGEACVVGRR